MAKTKTRSTPKNKPRKSRPKMPKGMTVARRIVWCFEHRATEAHMDAICEWVGIDQDGFRAVIGEAREIHIARDFKLTAIYDRPGWWTCRPTEKIIARYEEEAMKRNLSEQQRNARVYGDTRIAPLIETLAQIIEGSFNTWVQQGHQAEAQSERSDYVIEAVDKAAAKGVAHIAR